MNVVRDRPQAKWLPSRHRYALARLIAFVMLPRPRPAALDVDHLILSIDREQSALENHALAIWYLATTTCFLAALLPLAMPWALVAAFPPALIVVEIPIYAVGLPFENRRVTSAAYLLIGATASLYFAGRATWVRFPAYVYLGVLALNAIAFVTLWLLRDRVRAAEERCVA